MMTRRTIVVAGPLAADAVRLELAAARQHGVRVTDIAGLVTRLAGGFLRPVDSDALSAAIGAVLAAAPAGGLGDLEPIRALPGLRVALTRTLHKAWLAGIDLSARQARHQRFATLATIEAQALAALSPGMVPPAALVAAARARLPHAPAVLGTVELRLLATIAPVWRTLLAELAAQVDVLWHAGPRPVPAWRAGTAIRVATTPARAMPVTVESCAIARHEVIEALRWARRLIAEGSARPQDIAIAAASPGAFDDLVEAADADANLGVHFAHGRRALNTRDGQACAALADVLLHGLSQDRIRRLIALAQAARTPLAALPQDWRRWVTAAAPLTTPGRWQRMFARHGEAAAPVADVLTPVLALLDRGVAAAAEAGETLLAGQARLLWRRALAREAPAALERALAELRVPDPADPACSIVWAPAAMLAGAPRAQMRLLGINAGLWPRGLQEDPLLPDRIAQPDELEDPSLAERDRLDFAALRDAAAGGLVVSCARRDATGRLLGRSPLLPAGPVTYLRRARIPDHAASEADRLLARPADFATTPLAQSAAACWQDWFADAVTPHDGLIRSDHPAMSSDIQN